MIEKLKAVIFYIIFFFFVLAICQNNISYDYDLWARLIVGMSVVQSGHVLKHDFLSYTPTHTWFDHEWGSGVIFYLAQHFGGTYGIIFLEALLIFLIFFTVTKIINLRGVKTTSAYNFLFYVFTLSSINYIFKSPIRCQLFSFLFFAIFLYLLERARKGVGRNLELIIFLPVLMLVWNNLHGGCVAGIGLIVIYIIGELLNKKSVRKYVYALIPTLLVMPINPWGFQYLAFLFKASTMKRVDIIEWWGLFHPFNLYRYIKVKIIILLLLFTETGFAIRGIIKKNFNFDKTRFLLLAVTLFLAIQHLKLVPFFLISVTAFCYDDFYTAFNFLTRNLFNKIATAKDILIYIIIFIFICGSFYEKNNPQTFYIKKYPVLSVEFLKINNIKGNLLTNLGLGSYCAYKLYPNNKIFIDGRYEEVYYDYMMPMLKKFHLFNAGWDEILKKFPPDVMILEKDYPIYYYLKTSKDWALVFDKDKLFGVFVKRKNLKKHYKIPTDDLNYYNKTVFDTNINFMLQSKHEK